MPVHPFPRACVCVLGSAANALGYAQGTNTLLSAQKIEDFIASRLRQGGETVNSTHPIGCLAKLMTQHLQDVIGGPDSAGRALAVDVQAYRTPSETYGKSTYPVYRRFTASGTCTKGTFVYYFLLCHMRFLPAVCI